MGIRKILFVGLGGAGQRHLRIFRELLSGTVMTAYRVTAKTPLLNSDFTVNHDTSVAVRYGVQCFGSLQDALDDKPDLIVISTPTALHYNVALAAAERGIDIFIEKPFSHNLDGFQAFQDLVLQKKLRFFVSFQRRFHPYLLRIKELVSQGELGEVISAAFQVGSYVPDWHPYENFRELYACRQELGGGVLLTEIHELDLCCWYFGRPERVYCAGGNYSGHPLDVEDTAQLTLKYSGFSVQIHLCFMQKHNRRSLFIAGTKGYLAWDQDGNRLVVHYYDSNKKEILEDPTFTNEAMFHAQAWHFLQGNEPGDTWNYLAAARDSLAVVAAAKDSMKQGIDIILPVPYLRNQLSIANHDTA